MGRGWGALKELEGRGAGELGNCKDALEIGTGPSDLAKEATESSLKAWEIFSPWNGEFVDVKSFCPNYFWSQVKLRAAHSCPTLCDPRTI